MTRIRLPRGETAQAAARLFDAADALLALARPPEQAPSVAFARLRTYAADPGADADPDLERAIEHDPRLGRDYRRLIERQALARIERVRAASTGEAARIRRFPGGTLELVPSSADPGQIYLVIEWRTDGLPRCLSVFPAAGSHLRRPLPAPRGRVIQVLLDQTEPTDAHLIEAIRRLDTELFLT